MMIQERNIVSSIFNKKPIRKSLPFAHDSYFLSAISGRDQKLPLEK
jgi:hypothetical protein